MSSPGSIDARAQLSAVCRGSDDAIIATGPDGVITAWSHGAELLYGYPASEIVGEHISFLYAGSDLPIADRFLEAVTRGEGVELAEVAWRRPDGTLLEVELRGSPILDESGGVLGTVSIARDIGERLRRERELVESRALLERTQAIGHIGSWWAAIGPEALVTLTPEAYRILGLAQGAELRNLDFFNLLHPEDREYFVESVILVRAGEGSRSELEVRVLRPDGATRWILLAVDALSDASGTVSGITGLVQDITDRKEAELRQEHDALHDQLTGLPNRVLFLDRLVRALTRATRDHKRVAVLYVDLDHFMPFNDARGTNQGETVLRAVAERLQDAVEVGDSVARFGNDQFGLVCEGVADATRAAERAMRTLKVFQAPFHLEGGDAFITASVGIALSGAGASAEALLRDADLAMHRAKEQGRNRFEHYDVALRQQAKQRFAFAAELHRALEHEELFLEYQPIASMAEGRFTGAEALLRWRHPGGDVIKPSEFIPLAEESGLIVPIGEWVLDSACRQLRQWVQAAPECKHWRISVNVAASQLRSPGFVETVERAIERSEIDPASLRIELTESVVVEGEAVTAVLQRVRELGVRVSVDDFGTGYSSLSYLTRLPVDELKIDRSFITDLAGDESSQAVVSAILAIGRSLDFWVTAEGVDTEAQLVELLRLGCHSAQGFFFAPALSPRECFDVLRAPLGRSSVLRERRSERATA
ncbi:MAG: response regulator receiver modulated diguanylate cyclase/phosphodiesterase with sensor(s) [Acidimicrobiaceae bacterium]|nr:response regulator receiver modulated diguanylate cyclase/phosphodiesterase with sensor(s) [Acidimicrobiaceae bacterium]